jgi:hypothetical protein
MKQKKPRMAEGGNAEATFPGSRGNVFVVQVAGKFHHQT